MLATKGKSHQTRKLILERKKHWKKLQHSKKGKGVHGMNSVNPPQKHKYEEGSDRKHHIVVKFQL